MRIIDLLNKIAKGEEVPKKIKYKNELFNYEDNDYWGFDIHGWFSVEHLEFDILNDEIEIIEEKEIEEITLLGKEIGYGVMSAWLDFTPNDNEQKICSAIESIGLKINELVREVNKLKGKSENNE